MIADYLHRYVFAIVAVLILQAITGCSKTDKLLRMADMAMEQGYFLEPERRNAYHYCTAAGESSPNHSGVEKCFSSIANHYLEKAREAVRKYDVLQVRNNYWTLAEIYPTHNELGMQCRGNEQFNHCIGRFLV